MKIYVRSIGHYFLIHLLFETQVTFLTKIQNVFLGRDRVPHILKWYIIFGYFAYFFLSPTRLLFSYLLCVTTNPMDGNRPGLLHPQARGGEGQGRKRRIICMRSCTLVLFK